MEFLADYGEDAENSSNSLAEKKADSGKSAAQTACLQSEWESFEKMIGGGTSPDTVSALGATAVDPATYLQSGIVAYPGLGKSRTSSTTESSAEEPKSAKSHTDADAMPFSFEEVQDIHLPSEVVSRSRSRSSGSSRSSSRSSRSSSNSSVERKADKEVAATPAMEGQPRSSVSPTKAQRSKSPGQQRKSRSRSQSKGKNVSHPSPSRKNRSSSRSKRRRHGHSRSRDRHRRHRRHGSKDRRSRSRDRNRRRRRRQSHSHDRKKRSHRRRSHSRSRRRRSRSRGRHNRSRSRSHDRDRHARSRSHSKERGVRSGGLASTISSCHKDKPRTFKEQMRQQLLKASKILKNGDGTEGKLPEISIEKPNNLANNQTSILKAMAASVNSATASGVTPQMALLQTMAAMHQKAQELTGVPVPKYYNPAAVNPLKYAEQVQKRKLLWSKNKKEEPPASTETLPIAHKGNEWQGTSFVADQDGKMAAKFRKLMGMKEDDSDEGTTAELSEEQQRKQQELFSRLDKEYEFARMATHTHRGVGLGFATQINPNTGGGT